MARIVSLPIHCLRRIHQVHVPVEVRAARLFTKYDGLGRFGHGRFGEAKGPLMVEELLPLGFASARWRIAAQGLGKVIIESVENVAALRVVRVIRITGPVTSGRSVGQTSILKSS